MAYLEVPREGDGRIINRFWRRQGLGASRMTGFCRLWSLRTSGEGGELEEAFARAGRFGEV